MEDQFIALHGSRKRHAEKGFPWKADKDKPSELTDGFEEVEGYTTTRTVASDWAADGEDNGEELF